MKIKHDVPFQVTDISGLFSKYRPLILLTTFLGLGLGLAAGHVLPPKYKAHFVLAIDSKYFQSPLIRELVPELNERADVKAEVASLVRQALTPEFLDTLGATYGIYTARRSLNIPDPVKTRISRVKELVQPYGFFRPSPIVETDTSAARQALRERIEIMDINETTIQMSFVYDDPSVTFQATNDLSAHVARTLSGQRFRSLSSLRDAIQKRLQFMAANVTSSTEPTRSARAELAREELANVREQIQTMSAQYTEEHPVMLDLKSREQTLTRMLAASGGRRTGRSQNPVFGGESNADVREMYNDLLRKMNYLNIALETDQGSGIAILESPIYPKEPVGPKRTLLAVWGCAMGLFMALFVAAVREYFARSILHAETLAHQLGVPVLGKLPIVPWNDLKLIDRG